MIRNLLVHLEVSRLAQSGLSLERETTSQEGQPVLSRPGLRFRAVPRSVRLQMATLLHGRRGAFIVVAADFTDTLRAWRIARPRRREVVVIENQVFDRVDLERQL